jgi:hypothetical protein
MIEITKYGNRNWAIYYDGELLAVTVYKKGALAIAAALRGLLARQTVSMGRSPTLQPMP